MSFLVSSYKEILFQVIIEKKRNSSNESSSDTFDIKMCVFICKEEHLVATKEE